MAAPSRSLRVFRTLLREAHRHGRPSPLDYLTFLQIWLIPSELRRIVRDRILRRRRGATPTLLPAIPAQRAPEPGWLEESHRSSESAQPRQ
jgi:hypothetical protein